MVTYELTVSDGNGNDDIVYLLEHDHEFTDKEFMDKFWLALRSTAMNDGNDLIWDHCNEAISYMINFFGFRTYYHDVTIDVRMLEVASKHRQFVAEQTQKNKKP